MRGDVYSYADARRPRSRSRAHPRRHGHARRWPPAALLYSYPFVAHTGVGSHVIAPTAQIIARQSRVDQRRLPDEDAKSLVFDDTLLFDVDKFSGYDRFETGTRANVGVQYTFQANNGVYARAVFGQSYPPRRRQPLCRSGPRSDRRQFNFSPVSGLETDRSDYVAGLYLSPFAGLSLIAQGRFDEKDWTPAPPGHAAARAATGRSSARSAYTFAHFDPQSRRLHRQPAGHPRHASA